MTSTEAALTYGPDCYPVVDFERYDEERTRIKTRICGRKIGLMLNGPLTPALRNEGIAALDRYIVRFFPDRARELGMLGVDMVPPPDLQVVA